MTPAVLLLTAYGAGLATGLARFGDTFPVVLALGAGGLWWWRSAIGVWFLVAMLGRGTAVAVLAGEPGRCEAQLPAASGGISARVLDPVGADGGTTRLRLRSTHCRGAIVATWPRGTPARAGEVIRAEGRWVRFEDRGPRGSGRFLVSSVVTLSSDPDWEERLRTWVAGTIHDLYGARAGLVEALVLNQRSGMPAELRDRYARAGLVHILSISGFHVGVIVAWVGLLAKWAGLSAARAPVAAVMCGACYVLFLGWPAPAARAVLLLGLATLFKLRQRNPQVMGLLAFTALLVLLLDPWAIHDPGAWLSVLALGGAIAATRWSDEQLGRGWWWRTLSGSVGATLATAPVSAALFGTVSLAGVVLNFVAIPLAAIAVPGLLLSLIAAAWAPSLAPPLAAGSGLVLGVLDQVAWWGGGPHWVAVMQPTGWASALPWIFILGAAGWSIAVRGAGWELLRRASLAAAALIWVLAARDGLASLGDADSGLTLHFLDVGQGDAALVRTPRGRWVLIDAGPRTDRDDAGRRVIAPFLARHHAAGLAAAVISHAHADHLGGLVSVMERYPVGGVLEPAELVADPLYTGVLDRLEAAQIPWQAARAGTRFELDSVRFTLLHPDTAWGEWQLDLNEDSAVLLVEYRAFRALFPGDAGLRAESRLAGRVGPVDILKVGHHGSRSASGGPWLAELSPRAAIISTGAGNRYGHPHAEVLARLARQGIDLWRTDRDGTITVRTDGRMFTMTAARRHQTLQTRGLPRATEQPSRDHRALHHGSGGEIP